MIDLSHLTDDQRELFLAIHKRHISAMGSDNQKKYALQNVRKVAWDEAEDCLKVYYDGVWWHYNRLGEWY